MFPMHFSVHIQVKSSVSYQMIEMTAYSDDMCLNLERKKSGNEDTTSSGSYSEMCSTNSKVNTLFLSHGA